jgi:hypothetical protein
MLDEDADGFRSAREEEARLLGLRKRERFLMWAFHWGSLQGLDTYRRLLKEKAESEAIAAALTSNRNP